MLPAFDLITKSAVSHTLLKIQFNSTTGPPCHTQAAGTSGKGACILVLKLPVSQTSVLLSGNLQV